MSFLNQVPGMGKEFKGERLKNILSERELKILHQIYVLLKSSLIRKKVQIQFLR